MPLTPAEIQQRFAGQDVSELEQLDPGDAALSGDNGAPQDEADPDEAGIDVTNAIFSGFVIENNSGAAMTLKIWVLWKTRTKWASIYNVELSIADGEVITDELKTRGWERVYFERTDGNGGDWKAFIEELK